MGLLTEDVTHHRELEAAAESEACDAGDDRFAQRCDSIGKVLEVRYPECLRRGEVVKFREISASYYWRDVLACFKESALMNESVISISQGAWDEVMV